MNNAKKNTAICILGMHRSGTSTITRAVNLLGAFLGAKEDLLGASSENAEGFWERKDLCDFHDRLLVSCKRAWDTVAPMPRKWLHSEQISPFLNELKELIRKNFSSRDLWVWKDPRSCLLFPMWKKVLTDLDIELVAVVIVRNPLDVARSLLSRNGIPLEKSFGIWLNYNLAALQVASEIPSIFLSYSNLLSDWQKELKRCADGLSLPWPAEDTELKRKMNAFIRPDLRHSSASYEELQGSGAPLEVLEIYQILNSLCHDIQVDRSVVSRIQESFLGHALCLENDMDLFFEQRHEIERLSARIVDAGRRISVLEEQLSAAQEEIHKMLHSKSWRLTAPLRWINTKF